MSEHRCGGDAPSDAYGFAIDVCFSKDGEFWVSNGEYSSRVNFCPFCGAKAEKQMHFVLEKNEWGERWVAKEGEQIG